MNGRWAFRTIVCFVALVVGIPAFAQESKLDSNLDKMWGKERELKVIEKKQFMPDYRHEIGVFFGVIPSDPFWVYLPVGLRYDYHFMESLSFEVAGAYVPAVDNNLKANMEEWSAVRNVELPERLQWYVSANILWSPFHGKFAVMNKHITSFDAGFLVGIGIIGTQVPDGDGWKSRESYDAIPFNLMANLGAFIKFWATDYLAVSIDFRQYIYPKYPKGDAEWTNGVASPSEITVGLTYLTPAPK